MKAQPQTPHRLSYNSRISHARCSCFCWAMVSCQHDAAVAAHKEHIQKEANSPTPADVQRRALTFASQVQRKQQLGQ